MGLLWGPFCVPVVCSAAKTANRQPMKEKPALPGLNLEVLCVFAVCQAPNTVLAHAQVAECQNKEPHDWTLCVFAHVGEKARRRDPAVCKYVATACPDFRKVGSTDI